MNSHESTLAHVKSAAIGASQAAPALTAVWMWLSSRPMDFWLGMSGLVLIWVQVGYHVWKWRREAKAKRKAKEESHGS